MSRLLSIAALLLLFALLTPFSALAERAMLISLKGATVAGAPQRISVEQLEEMPLVEKTIFDPYLKKIVHYRGVPLKEFVSRFARPETKTVRITAIDEYVVTFSNHDLETGAYLLATRMEGALMSRGMSGPVKVVMQTDDPENLYVDKWIWMINRIEFLTD